MKQSRKEYLQEYYQLHKKRMLRLAKLRYRNNRKEILEKLKEERDNQKINRLNAKMEELIEQWRKESKSKTCR
jgi:hypothetical protein